MIHFFTTLNYSSIIHISTIYLSTHPFIRTFINSFIIYSSIHPPSFHSFLSPYSIIHSSLIRLSIHPFLHSVIHSSMYSFVRAFIHPFSFINLFILSTVHPSLRSAIPLSIYTSILSIELFVILLSVHSSIRQFKDAVCHFNCFYTCVNENLIYPVIHSFIHQTIQ